jgi:hypothetical protein
LAKGWMGEGVRFGAFAAGPLSGFLFALFFWISFHRTRNGRDLVN